ncbi:hypothetical protein [Dokdonella soli]|uniref:Replication protein n=1 Tax=Dokdonella soli TaxID=529810 RepID=A0ABP3TJ23_9GAMM
MSKPVKYSPEVRERAMSRKKPRVLDHRQDKPAKRVLNPDEQQAIEALTTAAQCLILPEDFDLSSVRDQQWAIDAMATWSKRVIFSANRWNERAVSRLLRLAADLMSKNVAWPETLTRFFGFLIDRAEKRDMFAARAVLTFSSHALQSGQYLPANLAHFLADALRRCMENPRHAGSALGLTPRRARPRSDGKKALELAISVHTCRENESLPLKDNRTREGAISKVARAKNVSKKTVERAWTEMKYEAQANWAWRQVEKLLNKKSPI